MVDLAQQAEALAVQAGAIETAAGELAAAASALALEAGKPSDPVYVTRQEFDALAARVAVLEGHEPEEPTDPEPVPADFMEAPKALLGWTVPVGKNIALKANETYTGTLIVRNRPGIVIAVQGDGMARIETTKTVKDRHGVILQNCPNAKVSRIHTVGGWNGWEIQDCPGAEIEDCEHEGSRAHGVNCRGDMTGAVLRRVHSHHNGTIGGASDGSNVGHAFNLNTGCRGVTLEACEGDHCCEDGVQQGPDCGAGNSMIDCLFHDNLEDGADIKNGTDTRYEGCAFEANAGNAFNAHPSNRAVIILKGNAMKAAGDSGERPGSCAEFKRQATIISEGGNYYEGIPGEAPAVKIRDGDPEVHLKADHVKGGGNSERDCAIFIEAGSGHTLENVTGERDGILAEVTGSANDVTFTGGDLTADRVKVDGGKRVTFGETAAIG